MSSLILWKFQFFGFQCVNLMCWINVNSKLTANLEVFMIFVFHETNSSYFWTVPPLIYNGLNVILKANGKNNKMIFGKIHFPFGWYSYESQNGRAVHTSFKILLDRYVIHCKELVRTVYYTVCNLKIVNFNRQELSYRVILTKELGRVNGITF